MIKLVQIKVCWNSSVTCTVGSTHIRQMPMWVGCVLVLKKKTHKQHSKSFTCHFLPSIPLLGWTHSFVSSHEGIPLWDCWSSESSCWSSHSYRSYSSALSPMALSSCPTGSARIIFLLPQPDSLARPTVNNRETALASNSQILCLRNGQWEMYFRTPIKDAMEGGLP